MTIDVNEMMRKGMTKEEIMAEIANRFDETYETAMKKEKKQAEVAKLKRECVDLFTRIYKFYGIELENKDALRKAVDSTFKEFEAIDNFFK